MPFRRQIRRLRFWRRRPASSQPDHTDSHETTQGRVNRSDHLIPRPYNEESEIGPAERYVSEDAQNDESQIGPAERHVSEDAQMQAIQEHNDQDGDTQTGGWGFEGITATTETETRVETLTDQTTGTNEGHVALTNEPSEQTRGNDTATTNQGFPLLDDVQSDNNFRRNIYLASQNGLNEPEQSRNLDRNRRQTDELVARARETLRRYHRQLRLEQGVTPRNQTPAAQFAPLADRAPREQPATIQEHPQENLEAAHRDRRAIQRHEQVEMNRQYREAIRQAAYDRIHEQSRRQGYLIAQLQSQVNALRLRLDAQDHVINTVRTLVAPLHDRTTPNGERVLGDHTILMRINERLRLDNQMRDWDHPDLVERHQDLSFDELVTEHHSMRDNQGYVEVMLGRSMPAGPPSSPPPPHETSPPPRAQAPPMRMDNVAPVIDMPGQDGARHAAQVNNLVNLELALRAVDDGGNQS